MQPLILLKQFDAVLPEMFIHQLRALNIPDSIIYLNNSTADFNKYLYDLRHNTQIISLIEDINKHNNNLLMEYFDIVLVNDYTGFIFCDFNRKEFVEEDA